MSLNLPKNNLITVQCCPYRYQSEDTAPNRIHLIEKPLHSQFPGSDFFICLCSPNVFFMQTSLICILVDRAMHHTYKPT